MATYEAYDIELSDDEIEFLEEIARKKRKRKKILITLSILLVSIFIGFSVGAIIYSRGTDISDIVERIPGW